MRRSSRKILTELRVGDVEEGQKWRASSRGREKGEGVRFSHARERGIVANTHSKYTRYTNTRVARVRTFEESFVSD